MAYFKKVTEKSLQEAVRAKAAAAGLSTSGNQISAKLVEMLVPMVIRDWVKDIEDFRPGSEEYNLAKICLWALPALLYDPETGAPKRSSRSDSARQCRDALLNYFAMTTDQSAGEIAERYLLATSEKYAKEHASGDLYRELYKKPQPYFKPLTDKEREIFKSAKEKGLI